MTIYLSNRDGNGKTSEEGHFKFPTSTWSGNVLNSTALAITQNSPLGMSVLVAAGQYKIDTSTEYSYTGWNSASQAVAISTADPANPRITCIVLYVDKGAATSASPPNNPGITKLIAVNGTPAASPVAPSAGTIQTAVGAGNPYIILANVTVPTAATQIINSNISDQRIPITVGTNMVNASSLQADAVTTAKIQNLAVTGAKIADNTITGAKLQDGTISITKILNPYRFSAYRSGAQSPSNTPIVYNIENFDPNNNFDTSIGRYTAPVSGFYQFNVVSKQQVSAAPNDPQAILYKNGTTPVAHAHFVNMYNGASEGAANFSVLLQLNAGDYVEVRGYRPLAVSDAGRNVFSGFLVCPV